MLYVMLAGSMLNRLFSMPNPFKKRIKIRMIATTYKGVRSVVFFFGIVSPKL